MAIKFSLVIPTYNEALNIAALCQKITGVLNLLTVDFEIIIVDDDSPDLTWKVAEDLALQDCRIKALRRIHSRGLGQAVISGWKNCQGEIIGVIDGDLQHPPELLKEMLDKIINNAKIDIVVASRYVAGGGSLNRGFWQRFKSRSAVFFGKIFVPKIFKLVQDPLSGYFLLRSKVVALDCLKPVGYKILLEVLAKGAYSKVLELPYIQDERKKGKSKAGWYQYFLSLVHFIKLR